MSLDDLVSVDITADSTSPTRPGFGTILCLVSTVPAGFSATTTTVVKALTDMADLGFDSDDSGYVLVKKIFSQKVRPKQVKLWQRSSPNTFGATLTLGASSVVGATYTVSANGVECEHALTSGEDQDDAATSIAALIGAVDGVAASATGAVITVTSSGAAGTMVRLSDWSTNIKLENTTADVGTDDDLDAALVADSDWYGVALDGCGKAEILTAASWCEANKKLFTPHTCDSEVYDAGVTDDVASEVKTNGYVYTAVLFNGNDTFSFAGAGWMGGRFPSQPGSYTWAYKQIGGVSPDALTPTQQTALENKRCNTYTKVAGVPVTLKGITGGGEYIDVTQFIDWLKAEIQVRVFGRMVNLAKIPYTDLGVDIIISEIMGALMAGVRASGLDPGDGKDIPAPSASAPKVADVDVIDRANRHLPDVKFSGRLAGAIHDLSINGTLSV